MPQDRKEYYLQNKWRWRESYKRCKVNKKKRNAEYRQEHKEGLRIYMKDYQQRVRLEIMRHYSKGTPRCNVCGETRIACLSIDHINGGGGEHKRQIGIKGGSGFYGWIIRNNFPDDLQILCMNCQFIKRHEQRECFLRTRQPNTK